MRRNGWRLRGGSPIARSWGTYLRARSGTIKAGHVNTCPTEGAPMRFGLVTYNWGKDWDLPTLLKNCAAANCDGVELRTTHKHGVEPKLNEKERLEVARRFADSPVVGHVFTCPKRNY